MGLTLGQSLFSGIAADHDLGLDLYPCHSVSARICAAVEGFAWEGYVAGEEEGTAEEAEVIDVEGGFCRPCASYRPLLEGHDYLVNLVDL